MVPWYLPPLLRTVANKVRPLPSSNPALAPPVSTPNATVVGGTLGPAAGPTPVTILATLATLTSWPLLARAGAI